MERSAKSVGSIFLAAWTELSEGRKMLVTGFGCHVCNYIHQWMLHSQNARSNTSNQALVTLIWFDLHRLPEDYRIHLKILVLACTTLNGQGPGCLSQVLHKRSSSSAKPGWYKAPCTLTCKGAFHTSCDLASQRRWWQNSDKIHGEHKKKKSHWNATLLKIGLMLQKNL